MSAEPCARCQTELAEGDLRCPICALATPQQARASAAAGLQILRCDGCGVAMRYDPQKLALACAFCGASVHAEHSGDPIEATQAHLPFHVDATAAKAALRTWQQSLGFFRPSNLERRSALEGLTALYFVGWLCDGEAQVSATADTDAGRRRAPYAPHAVSFPLRYTRMLVSASKGLVYDEVATLASSYRIDEQHPGPPPAEGYTVEEFALSRSAARRQVLTALHNQALEAAKRALPGHRMRNLKAEIRLSALRTQRLAFPAWVLAYRYGAKSYRVVISGHDPQAVRGEAPYSAWKIGIIVVVILAGIVLSFVR